MAKLLPIIQRTIIIRQITKLILPLWSFSCPSVLSSSDANPMTHYMVEKHYFLCPTNASTCYAYKEYYMDHKIRKTRFWTKIVNQSLEIYLSRINYSIKSLHYMYIKKLVIKDTSGCSISSLHLDILLKIDINSK